MEIAYVHTAGALCEASWAAVHCDRQADAREESLPKVGEERPIDGFELLGRGSIHRDVELGARAKGLHLLGELRVGYHE